MNASTLVELLQELILKHGDLQTLCETNGEFIDLTSVAISQQVDLPPVFVIS
jgi:hypothetical protein